ncbi:unnamed protein product [Psylliodes chrysocephalus]|uniref:DUF7869 domain-containing protein n=1 Tax=Psylliodes chrysocephalus TaxID=3402493 RepID=A0A9P0DBM5_9CUCU|nr:unnamed protein product [Psylliodes chrysocephala]
MEGGDISSDGELNISSVMEARSSTDAQNLYLCGLITVLPVQRKTLKEGAKHYGASYKYRIRALVGENTKEFNVCRKAFIAIHGISKKKVEILVSSLKETGYTPQDKRGKHTNHLNKLSLETLSLVRQHINSFKGRGSHYSLKDSTKIYLSEELNVKKNAYNKISYESYRQVFCRDFNISFGYPRTDTYSACNEFTVKIKNLESEKLENTENLQISMEIKRLTTENTLHKKKAEMFYSRKKMAKKNSRKNSNTEAICMDFAKNLQVPNIPTNDIYYKRQLSVYAFNVHVLSTSGSYFYVYSECEGKKGSDDVCSLLHNFIYSHLDPEVKHLKIFCDSCSGQQKNFTFFRVLHNLVNNEKRLESVVVTFPIRGHSYMECDKNFGLVNQKSRAEVPEDWLQILEDARHSPTPFNVINVNHILFRSWTKFLDNSYPKKSPFPSRPIREINIQRRALLQYRTTYNGAWESALLQGEDRKSSRLPVCHLKDNEFRLPEYSYEGQLTISAEKFRDIQHLKKCCSREAHEFFANLPHQ